MLIDRPVLERQFLKYGLPRPKGRDAGQKVADAALGALALANLPLRVLATGGKAAYDALSRSPEAPKPVGEVTASPGDVAGLKFPPGHPTNGCVYVVNPVRPDTYIPYHQYHRVVLREKVAELFTLLATLRAKRARIRVVRGTLCSGSLNLGALIPAQVPFQLRLSGGASGSTGQSLELDAEFQGIGAPRRPDDLRWLEHESEWQSLVRGRLDLGLKSYTLTMAYLESMGVTAQVGAELEGQGYSLGGSFQKHEAEEWNIQVDFARRPIFGW